MIQKSKDFYYDVVDSVLRRAAITLVEDACTASDVEIAGGCVVAHDPDPIVHDLHSVRAIIPVTWAVPVWDSRTGRTAEKLVRVHVYTYVDMYDGRIRADTITVGDKVIWEETVRNKRTPEENALRFRDAVYPPAVDDDDCEIED